MSNMLFEDNVSGQKHPRREDKCRNDIPYINEGECWLHIRSHAIFSELNNIPDPCVTPEKTSKMASAG